MSNLPHMLIPLAPFLFLSVTTSMWLLVLFGTGSYKAHVTVGRPARSRLEMALIGTVSALVGYLVRVVLKAPAGIGR